jgi:FADH2 O2-dependent halogenase
MSTHEANRAYNDFAKSHDVAALERLARLEPHGAIMDYAPARDLLTNANQLVRDVEEGQRSAIEAAEGIFTLLHDAFFIPPLLGLADRSNRWYAPNVTKVMRTMIWARRQAPPETKELFGQALTPLLAEQLAHKIRVPLLRRSREID